MVWTEIKLPFNPPPLHMTSPWCRSQGKSSLVRRTISLVAGGQSEPAGSASTPNGASSGGGGGDVVCFYEWKHEGEDAYEEKR